MKLEFKHLAPYLLHNITVIRANGEVATLTGVDIGYKLEHSYQTTVDGKWYQKTYISQFQPVLKPLSDLTKEIEHNGEKFVPIEELQLHEPNENVEFAFYKTSDWLTFNWTHVEAQKLFEWHFDIEGLIEQGLAIDINTLK